jgi:hypothetical protein
MLGQMDSRDPRIIFEGFSEKFVSKMIIEEAELLLNDVCWSVSGEDVDLFMDASKQGMHHEIVSHIGRFLLSLHILTCSCRPHTAGPPIPFKVYTRGEKRSNFGKFVAKNVYTLDYNFRINVRKISTDGCEVEVEGCSPNHPKGYVRYLLRMYAREYLAPLPKAPLPSWLQNDNTSITPRFYSLHPLPVISQG